MDKRVEYQVCYSVEDRVTMVNGQWQGGEIPESNRKQEDLRSCPLVWDYLNEVGDLGWVLVTVLETRMEGPQGPRFVRTLYLKRSI